MINTLIITRGDLTRLLTAGLNENKKTRIYFMDKDPDPKSKQPVCYIFKKMEIAANVSLMGEVNSIITTWFRVLMNNAGYPQLETGYDVPMKTNEADIDTFAATLGIMAIPSIANGFVRGDTWGHNNLPPFAPNGTVISYTPEQEALPPTFDYGLPIQEIEKPLSPQYPHPLTD